MGQPSPALASCWASNWDALPEQTSPDCCSRCQHKNQLIPASGAAPSREAAPGKQQHPANPSVSVTEGLSEGADLVAAVQGDRCEAMPQMCKASPCWSSKPSSCCAIAFQLGSGKRDAAVVCEMLFSF